MLSEQEVFCSFLLSGLGELGRDVFLPFFFFSISVLFSEVTKAGLWLPPWGVPYNPPFFSPLSLARRS